MTHLISRLTATIANGASLSDALTIAGGKVSFIEMPAAWTPAVLTFQGSMDGTNYYNVFNDDGDEEIVFTEPSRRVYVAKPALGEHKYIKLRSGTSANAVAQGAARTIYVEVWG